LVTLVTAYSLRSRASPVSYRQRSWDSPFGVFPSRKVSRRISAWMVPHTVLPVGAPAAEAKGRPSRPRFLGFHPSESPWRSDEGLTRQPLVTPLGFHPSRVCHRKPCPGSRPNSSHTLGRAQRRIALLTGVSEYRSALDSLDALDCARKHRQTCPITLLGFLHRSDPSHSGKTSPGL
jgi:hypothetical protein